MKDLVPHIYLYDSGRRRTAKAKAAAAKAAEVAEAAARGKCSTMWERAAAEATAVMEAAAVEAAAVEATAMAEVTVRSSNSCSDAWQQHRSAARDRP